MHNMSIEQLEECLIKKENLIIIDTLTAQDFAKRNIPFSINIPFRDNVAFITDVEKHAHSKEVKIVIYCDNEDSDIARRGAEKLEKAGFSNVHHLAPGATGWFATEPTKA